MESIEELKEKHELALKKYTNCAAVLKSPLLSQYGNRITEQQLYCEIKESMRSFEDASPTIMEGIFETILSSSDNDTYYWVSYMDRLTEALFHTADDMRKYPVIDGVETTLGQLIEEARKSDDQTSASHVDMVEKNIMPLLAIYKKGLIPSEFTINNATVAIAPKEVRIDGSLRAK